jgi:hypothetical protein
MTFTDKNIIENYFGLFESLNSISKLELIEKLTKSIKADTKSKENAFFKSFGAFSTEKSSDEINAEIKKNRKFRTKDFKNFENLTLENWVTRT